MAKNTTMSSGQENILHFAYVMLTWGVRANYNWQDEAVTLGVIPAVSEKSE